MYLQMLMLKGALAKILCQENIAFKVEDQTPVPLILKNKFRRNVFSTGYQHIFSCKQLNMFFE